MTSTHTHRVDRDSDAIRHEMSSGQRAGTEASPPIHGVSKVKHVMCANARQENDSVPVLYVGNSMEGDYSRGEQDTCVDKKNNHASHDDDKHYTDSTEMSLKLQASDEGMCHITPAATDHEAASIKASKHELPTIGLILSHETHAQQVCNNETHTQQLVNNMWSNREESHQRDLSEVDADKTTPSQRGGSDSYQIKKDNTFSCIVEEGNESLEVSSHSDTDRETFSCAVEVGKNLLPHHSEPRDTFPCEEECDDSFEASSHSDSDWGVWRCTTPATKRSVAGFGPMVLSSSKRIRYVLSSS